MMSSDVMNTLKKLKGRPSVFACHRLIHEVASTTAYNYDKRTAVHSSLELPTNLVGAFSVLPRLDLCLIHHHRHYKDTFHHFAYCLFTCHAGKTDCFLTHHPNWSIISNLKNQSVVCVCPSDQCVVNKDLIYGEFPLVLCAKI
jgi:uncharacterized membrane protein (UPF0182 family)